MTIEIALLISGVSLGIWNLSRDNKHEEETRKRMTKMKLHS